MSGTDIILVVYMVLLLAGGLTGFLKAGSKVSLIMSLISAGLLAIFQFAVPGPDFLADIILILLLIFFGMRFRGAKRFIPAGLMAMLTLVTLILRFTL